MSEKNTIVQNNNSDQSEQIERRFHRTNIQRIIHAICLILPIISAFLGWYLAPVFWNLFKTSETLETFKFITSLFFFAIPSIIIFSFTRETNSIIKIRIFTKKKSQ